MMSSKANYPILGCGEATCQTIGYYLASRADVSTENPTHPPLRFLIFEDSLKFAFFPFMLSNGATVF